MRETDTFGVARGRFCPPRAISPLDLVRRRARRDPRKIALAWLLGQRPWIVPIPGTRRLSGLDENLGAASVHLSAADLAALTAAADRIPVQGERYPEAMERMTNR